MTARENRSSTKSRRTTARSVEILGDLRADGRRKRRPSLGSAAADSIDAGAAFRFGDGRSNGMLAGRKETARKLYRDGVRGIPQVRRRGRARSNQQSPGAVAADRA